MDEIEIRKAGEEDFTKISSLYDRVYGGLYPVSEASNPEEFKKIIQDRNHLWLIALKENRLVGSLVFAIDGDNGISKCYGAVVEPSEQNSGIMHKINSYGIESIKNSDIFYAVARAGVRAPQRVLQKLGFAPLGIFPNAMRIRRLETHGLLACFKNKALEERQIPSLIQPAIRLYDLIKPRLGLHAANQVEVKVENNDLAVDLNIDSTPSVKDQYYRCKAEKRLLYDYYPFYEPNLRFYTSDGQNEAFTFHNSRASFLYVLGVKTKTERKDPTQILESVAEAALGLNCSYIEMVVPSNDPGLQSAAYSANFLPSAYFPAFKKDGKLRTDCLITARLLVPPSFKSINNGDIYGDFINTYCDIYTERIRREICAWQ
jgi:RimJ/RimL family protein N-acetyltransferase